MNHGDIEELRRYITGYLFTLSGSVTLIRTRRGIVPASKRVLRERALHGRSTWFHLEVWDGSRVTCSPGAHSTGQAGVRLARLEDYARSLPLEDFNPRLDVVRLTRRGDVVTIEVERFNR